MWCVTQGLLGFVGLDCARGKERGGTAMVLARSLADIRYRCVDTWLSIGGKLLSCPPVLASLRKVSLRVGEIQDSADPE